MELTENQAIKICESNIHEDMSDEEIVSLQLYQRRMCVPIDVFMKALNFVFKRSVYTHELANQDKLIQEHKGLISAPSLDEIVDLIPKVKRIII